MTEVVYTPAKEIQEYHYHKKRLRVSQWVRFAILVILIVVMGLLLITNKDAYTVQTTMTSIREIIGTLKQEYTYLATEQYELLLQRELNNLSGILGDIYRMQAKFAMNIMLFGYFYVSNSERLTESKRLLEGSKTEELRA